MIEDMTKHTRSELAFKHIQRAQKLLREEMDAIVEERGSASDIPPTIRNALALIVQIAELMHPVKNEWPTKNGKCQVVDLTEYRQKQLEAVCKGG